MSNLKTWNAPDPYVLLELAHDAVFARTLDDSTILWWNQAAEQLYGWTEEEVLGQVSHELLRTEFPEPLAGIEAAVARQHMWKGDLVQSRRDGSRVVVASRWAIQHTEKGSPMALLEFDTDISDRRRAEVARLEAAREHAARQQAEEQQERLRLLATQLEQAVQSRDELLAVVSHDLRYPLTYISALAQLLQRRTNQLAELEAGYPARIQATASKMAMVIDDLLDVAAIQLGQKLSVAPAPVDLVSLVHRVADMQRQITPDYALTVRATRETIVLVSDASRLERVLTNLTSNAVKYSPAGGTISLEIDEQDEQAQVTVHDQGIGIPRQELRQVFERGRRANNVAGIRGAGLGLFSARQILEQLGGTISVQSRKGHGSRFRVTLPLKPASAARNG